MSFSRRALPAAAAALALAVPAIPAQADDDGGGGALNPQLYSLSATVKGHSVLYWYSEFLVDEMETPAEGHPLLEPSSPLACDTAGPVAFLGGAGTGGKVCEIPQGKPVLISPSGWECSTAEGRAEGDLLNGFHGETFNNLRHCANANFARDMGWKTYDLDIRVDGDDIARERNYVATSLPRVANLPENNIWTAFTGVEVPAGPTKTITKGWAFLFRPMDPGMHRIRGFSAVDGEPAGSATWLIRVIRTHHGDDHDED